MAYGSIPIDTRHTGQTNNSRSGVGAIDRVENCPDNILFEISLTNLIRLNRPGRVPMVEVVKLWMLLVMDDAMGWRERERAAGQLRRGLELRPRSEGDLSLTPSLTAAGTGQQQQQQGRDEGWEG
jgi:hypothetical protein